MADDIRLEGFAEHLRGKKIYCVADHANIQQLVRSCVSSLDTEVAHRGRKALFVQEGCAATSWLLRMKWDAVFHLRETQDIRLALTYAVNAAKPVRIVWAGGEPSIPVFQQISKQDNVSLIGFGANAPKSTEWDAIFWKGVDAESIEPLLHQRIGIQMTDKYHLKTVLKELKSSELALVWSSIGESDKNGSLYWHDPSDANQASTYSPEEAADILRTIADSLSRATAKY
jgi:hypothetical protein